MRVIGAVGYFQSFIDVINAPAADLGPVEEAMSTHRPWFVSSAEEFVQRYPRTRRYRRWAASRRGRSCRWSFRKEMRLLSCA